MVPVPDQHFGSYTINEDESWGEKLTYVTDILKDKRGRTVGYLIEDKKEVSVHEAISLTKAGLLDNVVIVRKNNGRVFLRSKKNVRVDDNLTA